MYACPVCLKNFATSYTLQRHRASIHGASSKDSADMNQDDDSSQSVSVISEDQHNPKEPLPVSDDEIEDEDNSTDEDENRSIWTRYTDAVLEQHHDELNQEAIDEKSLESRRLGRELNEAFLGAYESDLLLFDTLKTDPTTEKVLSTRTRIMKQDDMGATEALKVAVERRKHLILENAPDWFELNGNQRGTPETGATSSQ